MHYKTLNGISVGDWVNFRRNWCDREDFNGERCFIFSIDTGYCDIDDDRPYHIFQPSTQSFAQARYQQITKVDAGGWGQWPSRELDLRKKDSVFVIGMSCISDEDARDKVGGWLNRRGKIKKVFKKKGFPTYYHVERDDHCACLASKLPDGTRPDIVLRCEDLHFVPNVDLMEFEDEDRELIKLTQRVVPVEPPDARELVMVEQHLSAVNARNERLEAQIVKQRLSAVNARNEWLEAQTNASLNHWAELVQPGTVIMLPDRPDRPNPKRLWEWRKFSSV